MQILLRLAFKYILWSLTGAAKLSEPLSSGDTQVVSAEYILRYVYLFDFHRLL